MGNEREGGITGKTKRMGKKGEPQWKRVGNGGERKQNERVERLGQIRKGWKMGGGENQKGRAGKWERRGESKKKGLGGGQD